MKSAVAIGLFFLVAICVMTGALLTVVAIELGGRPTDQYVQKLDLAGVLRNTPDGWSIQTDRFHEPIGLDDVAESADGSHLVVSFSRTFDVVHGGSVSSDEYFTVSAPVRAGLSLGVDRAQIYFATPDGAAIRPRDLSPLGNFFLLASGSVLVSPPPATIASTIANRVVRKVKEIAGRLSNDGDL